MKVKTTLKKLKSGDVVSIDKKKIKTRFPILFKRAVEFQMLKAKGRIG